MGFLLYGQCFRSRKLFAITVLNWGCASRDSGIPSVCWVQAETSASLSWLKPRECLNLNPAGSPHKTLQLKVILLKIRRWKNGCADDCVRKRTAGTKIWIKSITPPPLVRLLLFIQEVWEKVCIDSLSDKLHDTTLILKRVFTKVNCVFSSCFHGNCCGNKTVYQGWDGRFCGSP